MRHVLFMDEGKRAEGGISGEHQVPVRTSLSMGQAGWEVQALGRLPLPPPAWPAHLGRSRGSAGWYRPRRPAANSVWTSEPWSWGVLTPPQSTEKGAFFPNPRQMSLGTNACPPPSLHHMYPSHQADKSVTVCP